MRALVEQGLANSYPPEVRHNAEEFRKFLELPLHVNGPLACMSNGIDAVDPSWIIQAFENEEPRTIAGGVAASRRWLSCRVSQSCANRRGDDGRHPKPGT